MSSPGAGQAPPFTSADSSPPGEVAGSARPGDGASAPARPPWNQPTLADGDLATQPSASAARPPRRRVGRFELVERIGAGGFGEVWLAFDPQLERDVAVKLGHRSGFDDGRPELLAHEARAAGRLSHPAIVSVHETGVDGDLAYIVSDYVPGTTLERRLKAGPLPPREAAELTKSLAEALSHAHRRGVVHRDVKPSNVLIDPDGRPYLTDFGVARRVSGDRTISTSGEALGTPAYMAPEQAAGDMSAVDAQSDVYSLGLVFYEMLAGRRAYAGTAAQALRDVLVRPPAPLRSVRPDVPLPLATIVDAATARNKSARYASPDEFAQDLSRFLEGRSPEAAGRRRTKRRLRVAAAACAAAAVSVGAVLARAGLSGDSAPVTDKRPVPVTDRRSAPAADKQSVELRTEPPADRLWIFPRDPVTSWPMPDRRIDVPDPSSPIVELDPGREYLIVADWGGGRFGEFDRRVPTRYEVESDLHHSLACFEWHDGAEGSVRLEIAAPAPAPAGLVLVPDGDFVAFVAPDSGCRLEIPSYHLASHELTAAEYLAIEAAWRSRHGLEAPAELPSYLPADFPPDQPVRLSHADAASIAAKAGCRLPDLFELEHAARSTSGRDGTAGLAIAGLRSGPAEMTESRVNPFPWEVPPELRSNIAALRRGMPVDPKNFLEQGFFIFGEPEEPVDGTAARGPRPGVPNRPSATLSERRPDVGVRLARSVRPRHDVTDFIRVASPDGDAPVAGNSSGDRRDPGRAGTATPAATAQVSSGSIRIMRTE